MFRRASLILQAIESHWALVGMVLRWLLTIGSGAMSAWAAYATATLAAYSPLSWIAAGLLGALVFVWVLAGGAWLRANLYRASMMQRTLKRADIINPLDDNFNKVRIRTSELLPPGQKIIRNKTFRDCEIVGPDVAAFGGCFLMAFRGIILTLA